MTNNPYIKPHATAPERVQHLRDRGLIIMRPNVAARKIEEIGYERLRIYFLSRRQLTLPDRPFRANTTYNDILEIYKCDALLRDMCFNAVGRFELAFRNRIAEVLSAQYGSHPYFEQAAFRNSERHNDALQSMIRSYGATKDPRAKHYKQTYTEPPLPPIWMMKEFLTFGTAARLYGGLSNAHRQDVATHFGIRITQIFDNWVKGFVDLRNFCAHHDRLFNRVFQKELVVFRNGNVPVARATSLKAYMECLDYVLNALNTNGAQSNLVSKGLTIINRHPAIALHEAGY